MALRSQNGEARAGDKPVPPRGREDGVGSRCGNVRDLDTARELQGQVKDKRDWSGAIDEQIRRTLLTTGYFHADDLDPLGVPPEHAQLKGTRSAWFRNQGFMEKTGAERKVAHKAANGRKAHIHRITPKGRRELTAGVGSENREGSAVRESNSTLDRPAPVSVGEPTGARSSLTAHPGVQSAPTGVPSEETDRLGLSSPNPPVPSVSDQSSPVADSTSHDEVTGETLSLLPPPDPEAWAA